jgi:hypothetical protein
MGARILAAMRPGITAFWLFGLVAVWAVVAGGTPAHA